MELLEGWLVTKVTKNPPHILVKGLLRDALERLVPPGWFLGAEDPLTTGDSEPEPDLAIVRGERRDFAQRHPGPADVALIVEVADASLRRDRNLKQRIYARSGIPEYWIVSLVDRRIEVYTEPGGPDASPTYVNCTHFGAAEAVPVVIDGQEIGRIVVAEVLP